MPWNRVRNVDIAEDMCRVDTSQKIETKNSISSHEVPDDCSALHGCCTGTVGGTIWGCFRRGVAARCTQCAMCTIMVLLFSVFKTFRDATDTFSQVAGTSA